MTKITIISLSFSVLLSFRIFSQHSTGNSISFRKSRQISRFIAKVNKVTFCSFFKSFFEIVSAEKISFRQALPVIVVLTRSAAVQGEGGGCATRRVVFPLELDVSKRWTKTKKDSPTHSPPPPFFSYFKAFCKSPSCPRRSPESSSARVSASLCTPTRLS